RVARYPTNVGISHRPARPLDADTLDGVRRFPQPGGIDQRYGNVAERESLMQLIAGRTRYFGDDRAIAAEQSVEEAGFADIRTAYDRNVQAFAYQPAGAKCVGHLANVGGELL